MNSNLPKLATKLLGDAGEHFALSQLSFAGLPSTKMPENWKGYDLAVETGSGLERVSVKTRSETLKWKANRWFNFDDRLVCEWIVFVFKPHKGPVRAWVLPFSVALEHSNVPGLTNKTPWFRDLSWHKLNKAPLSAYENNWTLSLSPALSDDK